MERDEDIHDELKEIAPGFPVNKSMDPPQDYFETFPDKVLNRFRKEESQIVEKKIVQRRWIGIAAVLAGLSLGVWWYNHNSASDEKHEITAMEAYQYVHENINEFSALIEMSDVRTDESQLDIPQEAIEEYLMQEMRGSDPEILF